MIFLKNLGCVYWVQVRRKSVVKSYNNPSGPAAVINEVVHPVRGSLQTRLDSLQCLWQTWENYWHKSSLQKVPMLLFLADPVHIVPTKPTWSLLIILLEAMAFAGCWTDSKSSVQHLIWARLEKSLEMMQMHGVRTSSYCLDLTPGLYEYVSNYR